MWFGAQTYPRTYKAAYTVLWWRFSSNTRSQYTLLSSIIPCLEPSIFFIHSLSVSFHQWTYPV